MDPVIRTRNLAKAHAGAGAPALRGVSLQVAPGEHVAVMGPSGSGKSTLLHLLGLLGRPSGGTYFLDGEDVAGLPPDRLSDLRCRKIGMVFQAFNLLPRSTARENVELPMIYAGIAPAERRRRAEEALERVGLARRSAAWPHQLSGGEQQRVAIARAVVNRPRVILADEPTGALDSATGATILDLFAALNAAGSTLVLVTHDREVARRAGRLLTMRDGRFLGGGDA